MSKIIILNGFHAGTIVSWRDLPPFFKISKPKTITTCDCDEELETFESDAKIITYKRTFISIDGKWGLYTDNGNPEEIISGRDWIENHPMFKKKEILHLDCRDERAWK